MKRMTSILLILAIALSLTACGTKTNNSASGDSEKGIKEKLTVVLSGEPLNFNPQICNMLNAYIVEFLVYDTLVEKDDEGNIVPNLAESWEMTDDTHIRFKLRDDVYFSTGEKMTAEDVVFTINRCATGSTTKSTFKYFDGENTVAEDEHTVVIALTQPFASVYGFLTHAYSSIVCKSYVEAVGDDEAGLNPVGTGAYVLDKWVSGSSILLKKNESYWGEEGKSDYIEFKIITESANRAIELETGAADVVRDLATTDASRIDADDRLKLVSGPSYKTAFVGLNLSKEETGNAKIREALSCALDIETLAGAVYEQYAVPADSIMSTTIKEHASVSKHEYDVKKAKRLLAEAGYPDGITLTGRSQTNVDFKTASEVVQNMLKDAGIMANIEILDKATYSEKGKENGGTNITITSQTATTGDAYQAIGTIFSTTSRTGIINSNDERLEEMISEASAEYDDDRRKELYREIQDYIVNNHYAIPIAFTGILTGITKDVQNFRLSPANTPDFTYVFSHEN